MRGRLDEARLLLAEGRGRWSELAGVGLVPGLTGGIACELEMLAGNPVGAEEEARTGFEVLQEIGELGEQSTLAGQLAQALCALGRYDEAEHWAETGQRLAASHFALTQILWRQAWAKVLAHRDDSAAAERFARGAVALAEDTDMLNTHGDGLADLAEVLQLAGQSKGAADALEQAFELYERKGNVVMAERMRECLGSVLQ
jgi:tetratricopeptide (TPR) repeat protein